MTEEENLNLGPSQVMQIPGDQKFIHVPPKRRFLVTLDGYDPVSGTPNQTSMEIECNNVHFTAGHVIFRDGAEFQHESWIYAIRADRVWELEEVFYEVEISDG